jgi:uncharacterized membrane protein
MPTNNELIAAINKNLLLQLAPSQSQNAIHQKITELVSFLIVNDFDKLVLLLYRIDINEAKLKQMLAVQQLKDAAILIANLIIERELQKIKTRKEYSMRANNNNLTDDEKW